MHLTQSTNQRKVASFQNLAQIKNKISLPLSIKTHLPPLSPSKILFLNEPEVSTLSIDSKTKKKSPQKSSVDQLNKK